MRKWSLALALAAASVPALAHAQAAPPASALHVDTQYFTLSNGLRVVLTKDSIAPTVTVGVYYGIGFRVDRATAPASPTCSSI